MGSTRPGAADGGPIGWAAHPTGGMQTHVFTSQQWVPSPVERTFALFSDATKLEAITPPFLHFRIVTALPIVMRVGTLIRYRLRLYGVPVSWLTRIDEWRPNEGFVDSLLEGPYSRWVHRHTFEARDGGTLVHDIVDYALPLDPWSRPAHGLFVRPMIERIFEHRRRVLDVLLA